MLKTKLIVVIASLLFATFALAKPARAYNCTGGQYGSTCPPAQITIDKQIQNPITKAYVENLGPKDPTFVPGDEVLFKLKITNTGTTALTTITVKDVFPQYLTFESGPGVYNKDTNTLTIDLGNLEPGQSMILEILAKVLSVSAFPTDKTMFCVVNTAQVFTGNLTDEDTAQLCITTQVLGTTLPVAGYEDLKIALPFILLGLTGISLMGLKLLKTE